MRKGRETLHLVGEDHLQLQIHFPVFSCEDAAQQVLMYVRLSVRVSSILKF